MKKASLILAALLALALNAAISRRLNPLDYPGGRSRDDDARLRRNASSIARMIGEFRTSMSDIMFIKTERYLHGGIGYTPHMDESVLSAGDLSGEVDEHQGELGIPDDDEEGRHAGTATLIPSREQDFRGFVGVLHRQIKPWRDPAKAHIHTDGRELLPWFRAMTLSDPGYVRGYVAGGFWLQTHDRQEALAFIDEGLQHNPDSFELHVSRGFLLMRRIRDMRGLIPEEPDEEILPLLRDAHSAFRLGADLALRDRPEGGAATSAWGDYQENDASAAALMSVTLTRILGDPAGAKDLARLFLTHFPDFTPLQRALER